MIEYTETIVNPYWMYENEPMHLIRFVCDSKKYLFGLEFEDSVAISKMRKDKGYLKPSDELIMEINHEKR